MIVGLVGSISISFIFFLKWLDLHNDNCAFVVFKIFIEEHTFFFHFVFHFTALLLKKIKKEVGKFIEKLCSNLNCIHMDR